MLRFYFEEEGEAVCILIGIEVEFKIRKKEGK